MNASYRARLLAGAAAASSIFTATPVMAQACPIDDGTVACEDDAEASDINEALAELSGPSGVVEIDEGVLVTADVSAIDPQSPPIIGELTITNNGTIGSETNRLAINFQPPEGSVGNATSFTFA